MRKFHDQERRRKIATPEVGGLEQKARAELGVDQNAAFETIRRNYHALVMEYHPDRNPGNPEATEKCRAVIEAYTVLCRISNQSKTEEELRLEESIWNLFSEFWPVSEEHKSSRPVLQKKSQPRLAHEQHYPQFVEQRGFYDFIKPD